MSRAIPDEIVDEVRTRINIVDLISSYIPLKRGGNGVYKGLCPFHQEKTPSFTVNEHKQIFHCFGCGKGGDAFRFVMDRENVDFPEAIHLLADRCNVIIPEKNEYNQVISKKELDLKSRAYNLQEEFTKFFCRSLYLPQNTHALSYLYNRGITDDVIQKFRIGYSPDDWGACVNFARSMNYTVEEMLATGTIRQNENSQNLYDHFKGRLIFSIWDSRGKVVGFSGRTLDPTAKVAKYVNTSETILFKKSQLLYALPFARSAMHNHNMSILCEGQLDVIAMHRAGFECAVAPQGTAFTIEQAKLLQRYKTILLGFDSDKAGQNAILRAIELLLPMDFNIKVINFPGGKDPDELFKNSGQTPIQQAVNNAIDWLDFFFGYYQKLHDFTNPGELSLVIQNLVKLLKLIENQISLELYIQKAATFISISPDAIRNELQKLLRQDARRETAFAPKDEIIPSQKATRREKFLHSELILLELALNFENAARHIQDILTDKHLSSSPIATALNLVIEHSLTDDYANARQAVINFNRELNIAEINRILIENSKYSENQVEKAINDCILDLKQRFEKIEFNQFCEKIKTASSSEDAMDLLAQLIRNKPQ